MSIKLTQIEEFLNIAKELAESSSCIRRKFGAIIVRNDRFDQNYEEVISEGVNNVPTGLTTCKNLGYCIRSKFDIPRGTRYELCRSVHAEQNAILNAKCELTNTTLFLVGLEEDGSYVSYTEPCVMCKRLIIQSGIKEVICSVDEKSFRVFNVNNEWVMHDRSFELIDTYASVGNNSN